MAVNIDEGEPGTFKDRTFLERDPHRFLEGMLIAAQAVGIEACYLYLRDEYHGCRAVLAAELARLQCRPALSAAGHRIAPRCRRLYLWRRVGHDREHRGQAR
jgi:NADH:ubiquinone oxidoreductase subunit F (NADH-binding)